MNPIELQNRIDRTLKERGVLQSVNQALSQVLDFPDGYFVEIVLNDGSHIETVERALREIEHELVQQGVNIESVVRALWSVQQIEFDGVAYGESGVPRSAVRFRVTLRSGQTETVAFINVTVAAIEKLRQKLGIQLDVVGWAPERGDVPRSVLKQAVGAFAETDLQKLGGLTAWDPLRSPSRDLTAAAMSYLLGLETFVPIIPDGGQPGDAQHR